MTSVAYRLLLASKATSSGAMMSPPLALTVSTCPVLEIERADLAAGHLRDVDAPVGTGTQTVRAEQPARCGEAVQPPALGGGRVGRGVPGVQYGLVRGNVMTRDVIKCI